MILDVAASGTISVTAEKLAENSSMWRTLHVSLSELLYRYAEGAPTRTRLPVDVKLLGVLQKILHAAFH